MASERALWRRLRRTLLGDRHLACNLTRIETSTGAGVFDLYFSARRAGVRASGWLELKEVASWPPGLTTKVPTGIRPSQVAWARKQVRAGDERLGFLLQLSAGGGSQFYAVVGRAVARLEPKMMKCDFLSLCSSQFDDEDWSAEKLLEIMSNISRRVP